MKKFKFDADAAEKQAKQYAGNVENKFGMVLIEKNKRMPVESLQFNRHYQRVTETARKEKVKQGIHACGHFLPEKSITVNQNNEVVDGQHRLLAVKELGMSHIPVTKYYFEDKDKEASFFIYINGFDERLNAVDYWYAMYLSGDPLAMVMYKLESDSRSALKDKIIIKGKKTDKTKITVTPTLEIIGVAIGFIGQGHNWQKSQHSLWLKRLADKPFENILKEVNEFIGWYEAIFGDKKNAPWAYQLDSFRAIKYLYVSLKEKGWHLKKETVIKMKSFKLDATFMTAPLAGKKYQLVDHFNKNRKKERLPYNIS
ncbi:MAG: hypothetical protein R6V39_05300 [Desulfovibrionales bacterium]